MDDYEQMFRDSLEQHAQEVATEIEVPHPTQRRRWPVPLAAAAAVVVVAGGVGLLRNDPPDATNVPVIAVPGDWRIEQWHGIQVSVPPDWGWGGAPMADDFGGRDHGNTHLDCGAATFVRADGTKVEDRQLPYVGRPMFMTDVCQVYDPASPPVPPAPYVWLGAPIEPGTRELGAGWVQQTIEVAGDTVTVATHDETLRRQLLASARPAQGECAATLPPVPEPEGDFRDIEQPTSMAVCAYRGDIESGWQLTYSTEVDPDTTAGFLETLIDHEQDGMDEPAPHEIVLLKASKAQLVVWLSSSSAIELHGVYALTPETVRPWAIDGIPAYVTGPTGYDPALQPYFAGLRG